MTDVRATRRYARALYQAALKLDALSSVESDLDSISALLRSDDRFRKFLFSPITPKHEKMKLLESVFADRVTALTMQMLRLLLEKGRESEFEFIRQEYVRLRREHDQMVYAEVVSSTPLSEGHRDQLVRRLEEMTRKNIEAEFIVDPKVMGGLRVMYDNYVLDGTVRGALSRLREHLLFDVLKQG